MCCGLDQTFGARTLGLMLTMSVHMDTSFGVRVQHERAQNTSLFKHISLVPNHLLV